MLRPLSYAAAAILTAVATLLPAGPGVGQEPLPSASAQHVVLVSVDGLNHRALGELGRDRAPNFFRLIDEGAGTRNARTERQQTLTLSNHTSMVTGLRINVKRGGHGVTWNDDRLDPSTVQDAAGRPVSSVFEVVHQAGATTALFASKVKLSLYERSWPTAVDRLVVRQNNGRLVRRAQDDLVAHHRALTVVHLSKPDVVAHENGFMSRAYLDAVADVDRLLGRLLSTVESDDGLRGTTTLVLTSDHGGLRSGHSDPTKLANYRVPFLVWGAGVLPGADLYKLNSDYADPGRSRPTYGADPQPVRNGAAANLATDLLGLGPVPDSEHNAAQDLDVR